MKLKAADARDGVQVTKLLSGLVAWFQSLAS